MKKHLLSLEYCHVYANLPWEKNLQEIQLANENTTYLLKAFAHHNIQKCIMIDDLRSEKKVKESFIKKVVNELIIKPDVIYLESSFVFAAAQLLQLVNPKLIIKQEKKEKIWLKKTRDYYGSINEFLIQWRRRNSTIAFSCPMLVATSYLYRLGALRNLELHPVW